MAIVINLEETGNIEAAQNAAEALEKGAMIVYPTDTIYALGADAENIDAVSRVYALKGRSIRKELLISVENIRAAEKYVEVTPLAQKIAEKFWPGGVTIVMRRSQNAPADFLADLPTIGVRAPGHPFCQAVSHVFPRAIIATSVNRSGTPPEVNPRIITEKFGKYLDLIIDDGTIANSPSTVVGAFKEKPELFRQGLVPYNDVLAAIGELGA